MAEKSLDEIKADILNRAGRVNPFERVKREDVEQVLQRLDSLDPDLWGREWEKFGAKYEALGEEQEKKGKKEEAGEIFYLAYEYYRIGRTHTPDRKSHRLLPFFLFFLAPPRAPRISPRTFPILCPTDRDRGYPVVAAPARHPPA